MTHLSATAAKRRQGRRYVVPVVAVVAVAMLGAVLTLAASTPQARAQLDNTTCYTINDGVGTMTSWTSGTQAVVGGTGLTGVESLAANQDRNELWSYDDTTQSFYSFTPGSATPSFEFAFDPAGVGVPPGGIDGLTWFNHTDGDPSNDQLFGTIRNGVNDAANEADQIVEIDPASGAIIGSVATIVDPGAGSDELDDNDGLVWDPQTIDTFYGVIGGDTTANILTTITPSTGAITQLGLTLNGNPIYDIESLGAGTDGQLYGTTGEDNGPAGTEANQFISINKGSGAVTVIGAFGGGATDIDYEATACLTDTPLMVTPSVCYTVDESSSGDVANHLVRVDIAADTSVTFTDLGVIDNDNGADSINIESIAYRNGFEPRPLYTFDPNTATRSGLRISTTDGGDTTRFSTANIGDIDGLTWRNDNDADATNDELWGVVRNAGTPQDLLVELDPVDGTIISSIPILTSGAVAENDVDALAWDPATDTFFAVVNGTTSDNELITIDRVSGVVVEIGLMGETDIEGLGFTDAGELFATSGASAGSTSPNHFFFVNKGTGESTDLGEITDDLGQPLYGDYESLDCAGIAPVNPPTLDIITTIIDENGTCPVDYDAAEAAGNEGNDIINLSSINTPQVKYCFDIVNNGPGDATNVLISSPGNPDIVIGDLAVGAQAMGMTVLEDATAPGGSLIGTVSGEDTQGNGVPDATDPSEYTIGDAPSLDIITTIIDENGTCPVDYDAAEAAGNEGNDIINLSSINTPQVKYCFDIVNNGPGDATNVVISSPGNPDIVIGDLAVGAQAMGMTVLEDATAPGGSLIGTVSGEDTFGQGVPDATDPSEYTIGDAPSLDIITTIIDENGTCPVDYDAAEAAGNEGNDIINLSSTNTPQVKYCFDIVNNGPGDATNVVISSPGNPDIVIGDLAAGAQEMGMTVLEDATAPGGSLIGTVSGEDTFGQGVPDATDPSEYTVVPAPSLDIITTIIDENGTCPVDYDAAEAAGNEGLDSLNLAAPGDALVKYCFDIVNNGPGDAVNVVISSPALPADITIGNLAAGEQAMGMSDLAAANLLTSPVDGFVDGQDTLLNDVAQAEDPSGFTIVDAPVLDIITTIIDENGTCPVDYDAAEAAGNEGLDVLNLPAPGDALVKYCFDIINSGTGDAVNVVISSPALPADITIGNLAMGEQAMGMSDLAAANLLTSPVDGFVDGQDTLLNDVAQAEDPSGFTIVPAPSLDIITTIIDENGTCPVDYDAAEAAGNEGLDSLNLAAPGDALVKYCFDIVNNGPGDAVNVVISSPALPADITIGNLAAGEQAMGMSDLAAANLLTSPVDGFVDGQDTLLNDVAQAEDPSGFTIVPAPVLDIRLTVINPDDPATPTCPATYAEGIEGEGAPLNIFVGDNVKYCFNVINTGAGDAENVVVTYPTPGGATFNLGTILAGEEAMGMTAPSPFETGDDVLTTAEVNGDDTLGNPVTPATDPALVNPSPLSATIGDFVWRDNNRDGIQDVGEPGIQGVAVTVWTVNPDDSLGSIVNTVFTDALGDWGLDVVPGRYRVFFALPAGADSFSPQDQGGNDADDSDVTPSGANVGFTDIYTIANLDDNQTIDAGVSFPVLQAQLGNFVWTDTNNDGIQDAGELGIANIIVRATNTVTNQVSTTATDSNGMWLLNVDPGTYTVQFFNSTTGVFTLQDQGGDDGLDSDANASGVTGPVTVGEDESNLTIDAGIYFPSAAIGLAKDLSDGPTRQGLTDNYDVSYTFVITNIGELDLTDVQLTDNVAVGLAGTTGSVVSGPTPNAAGTCSTEVANGTQALAVGESCTAVWDFEITNPGGAELAFNNSASVVGTPPAGSGLPDVTDISDDGSVVDTDGDGNANEPGENDPTPALIPALASLGDTVFEDVNNNGIQDPGDAGVPGVIVRLLDAAGDPIPGIADDVTDGDGLYGFDNLDAGTYIVEFVEPVGRDFTLQDQGGDDAADSDADVTSGRTDPVTLTAGQNDPTIDAGVTRIPDVGSISNLVFEDLDGDGIQDPGEPGVAGVTVALLDGNGDVIPGIPTQETLADGTYIFANLPEGTYIVEFTAPDGRTFTLPNQGGDDTADSDAGTDGQTDPIVLGEGVNLTDVDAGIAPEAPVIGLAKDLTDGPTRNADGTHTIEYSFVIENLGPVPLTDVGIADDFAAVFAPATVAGPVPSGGTCDSAAAAAGTAALAVGESCTAIWTIVVTNAVPGTTYDNTAVATGTAPDGTEATDTSDDGVEPDTDGDGNGDEPGENDPTPASIPDLGSIGDFVWEDLNGDGIQDAGEPGIDGLTVTLLDGNGDVIPGIDPTTTAGGGAYLFDDLPAGDYIVVFTTPAGRTFTLPNEGADDGADSDAPANGQVPVTLTEGEDNPTIDAGIAPEAPSIGLAKDLTDGPTRNADGTHTIEYSFVIENLGPVPLTDVGIADDFAAVFAPATVAGPVPSGGTCDSAAAAAGTASLAVGESCTAIWTIVVTNAVPGTTYDNTAVATGTAPDGVIATDTSDDGVEPDTDGDGNGDEPGENDPTPASIPDLGSIGDFVWEDLNGDGIQDAGEPGIDGLTVTLLDGNGDVIPGIDPTTTAGGGAYLFDDLPAGDYIVVFTTPAGRTFTLPNEGADDGADSDAPANGQVPVTLTEGEDNPTIDAGIAPLLGSIGDFVWEDLNGDGIQDAGEPGIADLTVTLTDGNGDAVPGVPAQQTGTNGEYLFDDLLAGDYIVTFTTPAGREFTLQDQGGDDGADSDAPANGQVPVTLAAGGEDLTIDAGIAPLLGSIGDFVWEDLNGDGIQDAGEPGIAGLTVTLTDGNGDAVPGVPAQQTGTNGEYLFDDLLAGDYIVVFTTPAGREFTLQDQGGDDGADSDAPANGQVPVTLGAGGEDLTIDAGIAPEAPSIGLAKDLTDGPTRNADGTHTIEYSFVIENLGPVPLTDVGITDDFDTVFGAATVAGPVPSGGTCDSAAAFNGTAALAVGESCTAIWTIVVTNAVPGTTYDNTAVATGTAPDGVIATDTSDDGVEPDTDSDGNGDEPTENDPTPTRIPDLGSIGDFVWEDLNGDGIQDAGEPGIDGLTVTLLDGNGDVIPGIDPTTTAGGGAYLFDDLPAGDYIVVFTTPAGRTFTQTGQGTTATDSDAPANGQVPVTLTEGEDNLDVDAGIAPEAPSIGWRRI